MNSAVHKTQVDTPDELLAAILDGAGCIRKREDKLRLTTRDLHTRDAKCGEVSGEVYEYSLLTETEWNGNILS
jgi:hypothetical protein